MPFKFNPITGELDLVGSSGGMSIGGAVTSGTSGSVLYVDSGNNLAQDNSNLFWDATNHRLGLGTTSPNQQLELTKNLRLVESTTTAGLVYQGTNLLLHTYGGGVGVVNTFLGVGAGNLTNTSGGGSGRNVGIGKNALHVLADGYQDTVVGEGAGAGITDGYSNTLIGYQTGSGITTGFQNTAIGGHALGSVSTGGNNNAFGYNALAANTTGTSNLGFGYSSNPSVTTGSSNIAVGDNGLNGLTTGSDNITIGAESMKGSAAAIAGNTNVGHLAMNRVTTALQNTGVGKYNFYELSSGRDNTGIGYEAGAGYDAGNNGVNTGSYNTFLGSGTGPYTTTQRNYTTAIGYGAATDANNACVLGAPDGGTGAVSASIGIPIPLARLHLPAGTASANKAPLKFTTGTNLTTPESGAVEFDGSFLYFTASARERIVAVPANGRSTAQTAAVASITTFTVGAADASFLISANANITAFVAGTFNVQVTYTDETNTARTLSLNFSSITGTLGIALAAAGPFEGIPAHIRAKAATAITILTSGTFTSLTYNVEGYITQIG